MFFVSTRVVLVISILAMVPTVALAESQPEVYSSGASCHRELEGMNRGVLTFDTDRELESPPQSLGIPQIMDELHMADRITDDFPGGREWFEECYRLEYFWKPFSRCLRTYSDQPRRNSEERLKAIDVFKNCYMDYAKADLDEIADTLAGKKPQKKHARIRHHERGTLGQ